jgi:superfamily I DNA/RNA helicase/CRISPR/Cas system-associated exonuclease Cas4 (RecB family)
VSDWERVRQLAREFHVEVCDHGDEKYALGASAEVLLSKALLMTGVRVKGYPKKHPQLRGALARFERNTILFDNSVDRWLALYHQAHEFAHIRLGHGARDCSSTDIDCEAAEDRLPLGVHRVEGYSPHERLECEANVFAREFLLPCDVLQRRFIDDGLNAQQIADEIGVLIGMVIHQLARALLTPTGKPESRKLASGSLTLDESQRNAAEASEGPLLIDAGPGTGKTRTLVGRLIYLLKNNVSPQSILVLTFSNKAAEELRDRVGLAAPNAAQLIRIETFHSFGLELLRKYGAKIGLPGDPSIIDPVDALFLLEKHMPQLNLNHYQNLYEPTLYLNDILKAISRAKDENISPERYRELAEEMLAAATSPDQTTAAEKALEVAHCYSFYQEHLRSVGLLDFGDLICRSIELLQKHPAIREEVRRNYRHVLVDEYQDVNRASGLLLREVAGDGRGLWAVGDLRQSIHRWRGATTANMRKFADDFPAAGDRMFLEVNYRSQPPVVEVFSELVPHMSAAKGMSFTPWQKHRADEGGVVKYEIAANISAEAYGIARDIEQNYQAGISYREQAVICRSHTSLARIAGLLEHEGIPVLYLGDLFERPEVRDMLSLLSFACQPDGRGLVRVARFQEYNIPLADVRLLLKLAKEKSKPFPTALHLAQTEEGISPDGKEKMALLSRQLDGLCHGRSAWKLLTRYLFVTSNYIRLISDDGSVTGQQKRLALYQLLQFAYSQLGRIVEDGVDPKLDLLRYIRRLEVYGEEKQLRQIPAWAEGVDAVRVMTIHASKGLEFRAVYLPVLAKTYHPAKKGIQHCPPPTGMLNNSVDDWYLEEEECLFFVAMSRARDYLCLSRALRYGQVNRSPSDLLTLIASKLPRTNESRASWAISNARDEDGKDKADVKTIGKQRTFDVQQLEVYLKCPRRYYYEFELHLAGRRDDSAYIQFHRCVYEVLRRTQGEQETGGKNNEEIAHDHLTEVWQTQGPIGHPYEIIYRDKAYEMVMNAFRRQQRPGAHAAQTEHEISLNSGRVRLKFDYAELIGDGSNTELVARRLRTGRPTKSEAEKPIYGLYQTAAQQAYPNARRRVQILYLSTDETKDVELTKQQLDNRLKKYDDAIAAILQGNYDPAPDDRECTRCPHYFICPLAEDGGDWPIA